MMISREHYAQAEADLRNLIDHGSSLGDALRVLHHERHIGTTLLWPAVMAMRRVNQREAMRIVVHETAPWRDEGDQNP